MTNVTCTNYTEDFPGLQILLLTDPSIKVKNYESDSNNTPTPTSSTEGIPVFCGQLAISFTVLQVLQLIWNFGQIQKKVWKIPLFYGFPYLLSTGILNLGTDFVTDTAGYSEQPPKTKFLIGPFSEESPLQNSHLRV